MRLTDLQKKFMKSALKELQDGGINTEDCALEYDGILEISPSLTSTIIDSHSEPIRSLVD